MTTLRVKEICKEKNITLADLANIMGITPSALSQNIKKPSFETLERLSNALNVSIAELFEPKSVLCCPRCGAELQLVEKKKDE